MHVSSSLHPAILDARRKLSEGRERLKLQHDGGSPGPQVSVRLTDLVDSILLDLYEVILDELSLRDQQSNLALVPHGGYGRRDLAPFSDIDLMLLHKPGTAATVTPIARRLSQHLVDAGLQLGFSMRTPAQACRLAWSDPIIYTSLVESRFLGGSVHLFSRFMSAFRSGSRFRSRRLITAVEAARIEERRKFGETVYVLQPNIKRSRGGLRDVQLVRWIGFARYGESDLDQLAQLGMLGIEDLKSLKNGYQFLLRLRNQMHFMTNKSDDLLDRPQQIKLAEIYGSKGTEAVLPVEQFMQEYFSYTSEIRYSSTHFVDEAREQRSFTQAPFLAIGLPLSKDYRVGIKHVWATKAGMKRIQGDPQAVLEILDVANRFRKPIDGRTWRAIRLAMHNLPPTKLSSGAISRFMTFISRPGQLGEHLRRLHELRVLEKFIPAFKHARFLLQFNDYHKYTVDAHCIRSVECATDFEADNTILGKVYRGIKNKHILHLALLIHDLGKGFVEDHSEVGKRLAVETAEILKLDDQEQETLAFLVHKHLLMAYTAFRYDLNSNDTIVSFATEVGSSELLRMLFVLTCADLAAVGPDVLNQWKLELLTQLYVRTSAQFRDEDSDQLVEQELQECIDTVERLAPTQIDPQWWKSQIRAMPSAYLLRTPPSQIATELSLLQKLESQDAVAWGRFIPAPDAVEYTVAFRQTGKPIGTFRKITGVLSSHGMQILAAEIHTLPGQIAWDRFYVQDLDFQGPPPQSRLDQVSESICKTLTNPNASAPVFRRVWKSRRTAATPIRNQPNLVRFDNSTSDAYTIITVFAYDRIGLLYDISGVLADMDLVLQVAKISTHLDQVVDVFYVNDIAGNKVTESTKLYTIRQRLLKAIDSPPAP